MNREIKFRGKSACDESWQYGSLFIEENTNITDYKIKLLNYYILPLDVDYDEGFDQYEVIPSTVGQYTGLKDKNGKEIYEGDILIGKFPYANQCLVIWDKKACGLYLQGYEKQTFSTHTGAYRKYYKLNISKLEVIGNIHDSDINAM